MKYCYLILQTCETCRLKREVFHLALDYFDRYYVAYSTVDSDWLALMTMASLSIAVKVQVSSSIEIEIILLILLFDRSVITSESNFIVKKNNFFINYFLLSSKSYGFLSISCL